MSENETYEAIANRTVEDLVADGAAFLDRHRPDWAAHVDVDDLDMLDRCILDQVPLPSGWPKPVTRFTNYLSWCDYMAERGVGFLSAFSMGADLERAWRREVNRRQLLATSAEC